MNRSHVSKIPNNRRGLAAGEIMHGDVSQAKGNPVRNDWLTGSGIIDRMVAYRDWWNLPSGRAQGGARDFR